MSGPGKGVFNYIFIIKFSLKILGLVNFFFFLPLRKYIEFISFYVAELRFKPRISDSKFIAIFRSVHTFKDLKECT